MNHSTPLVVFFLAVADLGVTSCAGQIDEGDHLTGAIDPPASSAIGGAAAAPPSGATGGIPSQTGIGKAPVAGGEPPTCKPGFTGLRRLNRREYVNTLRDLLGASPQGLSRVPEDNVDRGFDTNAPALRVTRDLFEGYMDVAERAVADAMAAGRLVTCVPARADLADPCVAKTLTPFAERAYRRPLGADERTELQGLLTSAAPMAADAKDALAWAIVGVLTAPRFLYRSTGAVGPLNAYELASRLSYFLWSTMPDTALTEAARLGKLSDPLALNGEIRRMLKDPRTREFAAGFGRRWLDLEALPTRDFDLKVYPQLTHERQAAMIDETTTFLAFVLGNDRPSAELLTSDYSFVNKALAPLYGVTVTGDAFAKTSLPRTERRGVLTQASVLASTSHPHAPSVPHRGMWIMQNLLCMPPPPPPPLTVDGTLKPAPATQTLRQRLEAHRVDPSCGACHQVMDNLGFGLQNYAPTGAYRLTEDGNRIDASGQLPDGRAFANAVEMADLLAAGGDFIRCLSGNLLSYGLGRELTPGDTCSSDRVAELTKGGSVADLISGLATAEAFRTEGVTP